MLKRVRTFKTTDSLVLLCNRTSELSSQLSSSELAMVKQAVKRGQKMPIAIPQKQRTVLVYQFEKVWQANDQNAEHMRRHGFGLLAVCKHLAISTIGVQDLSDEPARLLAFAEGAALGNYSFAKYFTQGKDKSSPLKSLAVLTNQCEKQTWEALVATVDGNHFARDLINEPLSYLTAKQLGKDLAKMAKQVGLKVEVFSEAKIKSLKMGGLLAVNRGSVDPPSFTILEWKPKGTEKKAPIVLVGKGVVYDTGGLSLKPTRNSMDGMKADMGGAAAVAGTMLALAQKGVKAHVVALIPATDNRPGVNAYVPGDVVKMHSGATVEVLNTDAEGRMLLADALSYAKKYKPSLVIDVATLTGAAMMAVAPHAVVAMGTNQATVKELIGAGHRVCERVVELPLWDDYADMLRSTIADLKNVGGPSAGAITAGKFLQHFTKDAKGKQAYPWIHVDIAGSAFARAPMNYRLQGGTGVGVRLLFDFIQQQS